MADCGSGDSGSIVLSALPSAIAGGNEVLAAVGNVDRYHHRQPRIRRLSASAPTSRFQFSLAQMFVVMTLLALILCLICICPAVDAVPEQVMFYDTLVYTGSTRPHFRSPNTEEVASRVEVICNVLIVGGMALFIIRWRIGRKQRSDHVRIR